MVTLNIQYEGMGKGRRKCFGCNYKDVSQWCSYRWWKQERRKGYSFRMFYGKTHLLPTCRRENFSYKEQEQYKKQYCYTLGINPEELTNSGGRRNGGGGGRKRRSYEVY